MLGVLVLSALCVGITLGQGQPSIGVQGDNPVAVAAANAYNVDLMLAVTNINNDNYITQDELSEFVDSLDAGGDGNIRRCEFLDVYATRYNVSGPVASFLYSAINNPDNDLANATVINIQDFNVTMADADNDGQATLAEVRQFLVGEIYFAAVRSTQHKDLIIANATTKLPPSGKDIVQGIDSNSDGVISPDEMAASVPVYDTDGDGQISRCEWEEFEEAAGFHPLAISIVFDLTDLNNDNFLSAAEFVADLGPADDNRDGRITTEEYAHRIERSERMTRRQAGIPVRAFNLTCDWQQRSWVLKPNFKVQLFVDDADDNVDGVVTKAEYHDVMVDYFDFNRNTNISRCEFVMRSTKRYNVTRRHANAIFDALDLNRDDEITDYDVDVTVADSNDDGEVTTCELLLYMTYLTGQAEQKANRQASKLLAARERLRRQAFYRRSGSMDSHHDDLMDFFHDMLRGASSQKPPRQSPWVWDSPEKGRQAKMFQESMQWLHNMVMKDGSKNGDKDEFKAFHDLINC